MNEYQIPKQHSCAGCGAGRDAGCFKCRYCGRVVSWETAAKETMSRGRSGWCEWGPFATSLTPAQYEDYLSGGRGRGARI